MITREDPEEVVAGGGKNKDPKGPLSNTHSIGNDYSTIILVK